jgi:hypothetical protein
MMHGPLEYVLFQFDDDRFISEILPQMLKSQEKGCVKVVDLVFIMKDEVGDLEVVEVSELSDEDEALFAPLISGTLGLLSKGDIEIAAKELPNNATGAVLLLEHLWGVEMRNAVHASGGAVLDSAYISPQTHAELVVEMEQMEAENA